MVVISHHTRCTLLLCFSRNYKNITNEMSGAKKKGRGDFCMSSSMQLVSEACDSKHRYIITASVEKGWEGSDTPHPPGCWRKLNLYILTPSRSQTTPSV